MNTYSSPSALVVTKPTTFLPLPPILSEVVTKPILVTKPITLPPPILSNRQTVTIDNLTFNTNGQSIWNNGSSFTFRDNRFLGGTWNTSGSSTGESEVLPKSRV